MSHNKRTLDAFFTSSSKRSSSSSSSSLSSSAVEPHVKKEDRAHKFHIYCDLDGVLVDFDAGVQRLFPRQATKSIPTGKMWAAISRADSFYEHLPWTHDGKKLWNAIYKYSPDILTGCAMYKECPTEKFTWCQRELQHVDVIQHVNMAGAKSSHQAITGTRIMKHHTTTKNTHNNNTNNNLVNLVDDDQSHGDTDTVVAVNVITCWSKNKFLESKPGAVLIDDRLDLKEKWEAQGGIFIHHTNTDNTLTMLRQKKIIA